MAAMLNNASAANTHTQDRGLFFIQGHMWLLETVLLEKRNKFLKHMLILSGALLELFHWPVRKNLPFAVVTMLVSHPQSLTCSLYLGASVLQLYLCVLNLLTTGGGLMRRLRAKQN